MQQRALSVKARNALARTNTSPPEIVDERGFWDAESRVSRICSWSFHLILVYPASRMGSRCHSCYGGRGRQEIAFDCISPHILQHSVRYHPRKCDKCIKMDVRCIVLPDKKFGCTRLACANCDEMKITCAIDGVGIRQRLQAKAQKAVMKTGVDPEVKRSRTHAPKSRTAVKTPVLSAPPKAAKPSRRLSLAPKKVVFENPPIGKLDHHMVRRCSWSISITYLEVRQEPEAMMPDDANIRASRNIQSFRSLQLPPVDVPAPLTSSMAPTPSEPEPTTRDILQSIQDLGRRFDLLATDERVDALHVRLDSVERRISLRLTALEEGFSVSNAHRE